MVNAFLRFYAESSGSVKRGKGYASITHTVILGEHYFMTLSNISYTYKTISASITEKSKIKPK